VAACGSKKKEVMAVRIGDVAKEIGMSKDTLKRLERQGVVQPKRDRVGHRRYTQVEVEQIRAALFRPRVGKREPSVA
jgi:DNA-binding transcriptional MerR regulator